MTREEAKQLIPHLGSYNGEVLKVIDKIFDEFESRKCGDCEHFVKSSSKENIGYCYLSDGQMINTDYCNNFRA